MANPVLRRMSARPAELDTRAVTVDDVIVKTGGLLTLVLFAGVVGWFVVPVVSYVVDVALVATIALMLIVTFSRQVRPALVVAYAVAEGLLLGGLSSGLEAMFGGVVLQAVVATVVTFGVVLAGYRMGWLRSSRRLTRIALVAMWAYLAFTLVNLGLMLFGGNTSAWGLRSSVDVAGVPLGIVVGVAAVLLASYMLVVDFDEVKLAVERQMPQSESWRLSFGLLVTLVWLYLEFLRLFALLHSRD